VRCQTDNADWSVFLIEVRAISCGPEKMAMAALLGLAVHSYCLRPARLALTIFQTRWARGTFAGDLGWGGFYLVAYVGRATNILLMRSCLNRRTAPADNFYL